MSTTPPFLMKTPMPFFGVDGHRFKLGASVYEAVEDPSDGYRSYLESIEVRDEAPGIFFRKALDTVKAMPFDEKPEFHDSPTDGIALVSCLDGYVWLVFGTERVDDYYPCFLWRYTPRPAAPEEKT